MRGAHGGGNDEGVLEEPEIGEPDDTADDEEYAAAGEEPLDAARVEEDFEDGSARGARTGLGQRWGRVKFVRFGRLGYRLGGFDARGVRFQVAQVVDSFSSELIGIEAAAFEFGAESGGASGGVGGTGVGLRERELAGASAGDFAGEEVEISQSVGLLAEGSAAGSR